MAYSRADVTLSDFGSLRARFGWAAGCFMPYGFLGAGVGSRTINRFASASPPSIAPVTWSADTKEKLVYGYSAGFGLDTMIVGGLFTKVDDGTQVFDRQNIFAFSLSTGHVLPGFAASADGEVFDLQLTADKQSVVLVGGEVRPGDPIRVELPDQPYRPLQPV